MRGIALSLAREVKGKVVKDDTLSYMAHEPIHRRYHHDRMTFGLI